MPSPNTQFDLDVADLDLIETALRHRKSELSLKRLELLTANEKVEADEELAELDATLADTHDLLGRLHNQKVFYRPKGDNAPYVGG